MRLVNHITERAEVIAHRGASAYEPEHTLAAYDLAVAQGADTLELDLRRTADGHLVVVHDPTLLRTAGDPRRVDEAPRAAAPGALTLDDVLSRYGRSTRYLLELKDPLPAWEGEVAAAVDRYGLRDRAIVQSFDAGALRRLRLRAPWLACAPLYRRRPGRLASVARFACAIGVAHECLDVATVAAARAHGLGVRAWTVNGEAPIERVLGLGVDGVITDEPDVALRLARPREALPVAA